jgi:hypothetical protein
VDQEDVDDFVRGFREIIQGMVLSDVADERKTKELITQLRIISLAPKQGSYELTITLQSILDYIRALIDSQPDGLAGVVNWLELCLGTGAVIATGAAAKEIGKRAGRDLYAFGKQRLHLLLAMLQSIGESDWEFASPYVLPKTRTGLKRIWRIATKPAYQIKPITITSGRKDAPVVVFDQHLTDQMKLFFGAGVRGPDVLAYGRLTAWNSNGPYFSLDVPIFQRGVQCRYRKTLDAKVRTIVGANQRVLVTGTAYYAPGADQTLPPIYTQVRTVEIPLHEPVDPFVILRSPIPLRRTAPTPPRAPTLWDNMDTG